MMTEQMQEYLDAGRAVIGEEVAALEEVALSLDENFAEAVKILLNCKSKVVVSGIGKSGHIGRKIAATFSSTGLPAAFLHASEAGHGDLGLYSPGDTVIAISRSGSTGELVHLAPLFKQEGSKLICIVGRKNCLLAELADVTLEALVNREADPLGIVPTSSALVALAMGDALAGAVMHAKGVDESDFARYHPAGQLGRRLLLSIGDVMHPLEKCAVVEPDVSIRELVIEMTQNPLGAALVMKDRRELLGIITDGDLRRALAKEENVMDLTSEQLMTANPTCIASTASLHDAVKTMEERESQISVLPVNDVQSETAIGLVRLHDVYQPA
jgi:arabinose-5-phosphate isomerase